MSDRPFEVVAYTKTLGRLAWIGAPLWLTATPRHNQKPTASIALAGDDPKLAKLAADGARVVIHYRDEYLLGGRVTLQSGQGSAARRVVTFEVADDWRILANVLGWQVPGATLAGQSGAEHAVYIGPAETVVKTILTANLDRLSAAFAAPVTIAADLGRGATITVRARMDALADVLFPLVDQAGIGVRIRQTLAGLQVDCYTPTDWPLLLSEDGGTLVSSSWSRQFPTITRVVLAADGEGTARTYAGPYINAAAEAQIGEPIEVLVDARDLKHTDPSFAALAAARAAETLAAGAAKAGLSLELTETDTWRYGGTGVHVGDRVTVELAPGTPPVTDVLRSATLSWTTDEGAQVAPVVGERTDDPDTALVRAIAALGRKVRTLQAGV